MVQFTHVRQAGGSEARHITTLRWYNPADGKVNENAVGDIVAWLQKGGRGYVCDGSAIALVEVVAATPPYLRSVRDGRPSDNLLSLPRF